MSFPSSCEEPGYLKKVDFRAQSRGQTQLPVLGEAWIRYSSWGGGVCTRDKGFDLCVCPQPASWLLQNKGSEVNGARMPRAQLLLKLTKPAWTNRLTFVVLFSYFQTGECQSYKEERESHANPGESKRREGVVRERRKSKRRMSNQRAPFLLFCLIEKDFQGRG